MNLILSYRIDDMRLADDDKITYGVIVFMS